eukprot:364910-Chlamydomonas_euryale.AAC.1
MQEACSKVEGATAVTAAAGACGRCMSCCTLAPAMRRSSPSTASWCSVSVLPPDCSTHNLCVAASHACFTDLPPPTFPPSFTLSLSAHLLKDLLPSFLPLSLFHCLSIHSMGALAAGSASAAGDAAVGAPRGAERARRRQPLRSEDRRKLRLRVVAVDVRGHPEVAGPGAKTCGRRHERHWAWIHRGAGAVREASHFGTAVGSDPSRCWWSVRPHTLGSYATRQVPRTAFSVFQHQAAWVPFHSLFQALYVAG